MSKDRCIKCGNKLSWIGLIDSFLLAVFKGTIGLLTHSRALIASAVYSFHDVITSLAVIIGLKVAMNPPDERHPYGHGKAEYVISLFTSFIILGGTMFLLVDALQIIFHGEHPIPHWAAFGAALISLVANEIIYRYNICAFKHLNSPAMLTHGQHHRADAISSLAVIIAVLGGKMGFHFLDSLIAIFEAGHLIILSGEIFYHASMDLMDRAPDEKVNFFLYKIIAQITGTKAIKNIKTRKLGRLLSVDLHLGLSPDITVSEAQSVVSRIKRAVKNKVNYLGDINVIFEPR